MSYDLNIYSSPEKHGLTMVGEVEWGDGNYSFDLTTVWRDTKTGALYFADDSGCSCPSPYEDTGRADLTLIDRPQILINHVEKRIADETGWRGEACENTKGAAAELVQKVRGLLR
jgi:hypothetical protein